MRFAYHLTTAANLGDRRALTVHALYVLARARVFVCVEGTIRTPSNTRVQAAQFCLVSNTWELYH